MKDDEVLYFYEGKFISLYYDNRKRSLFSKLRYRFGISNRKLRFIENYTKNGLILDIGCGGGNEILAKKGRCIGVDFSTSSLKNAKKIYSDVIKASINNLPFKDNLFESVVSLDVLGHIPAKEKDVVISEISRVLKKDGISAHFIETKSKDPITKKAEEYEELFYKYFIYLDGHFGLETPEELTYRFGKYFNEVIVKHGFPVIVPLDEYSKRYNNEYKQKYIFFKFLVYSDKILVGKYLGKPGKIINLVSDIALTGLLCIGRLVFPLSWNGGIFVILSDKKR